MCESWSLTTENALNRAAHTTTTVSCELLAAKDTELKRHGTMERAGQGSEECVCEECVIVENVSEECVYECRRLSCA